MRERQFLNACIDGKLAVVKRLDKVDINYQDPDGYSGLMLASVYGHNHVVEYLIEKNAKLELKDFLGRTALMLATVNDNYEIVFMLLSNKADVNCQDNNGGTAIMMAAVGYDDLKMFKILLHFGADIDLQNNNGDTVLMFSICKNPIDDLVELIINNTNDVNITNKDGSTAVMKACEIEDYETIFSLYEKKAYFFMKNKIGETACDILNSKTKLLPELNSLKEKIMLEF